MPPAPTFPGLDIAREDLEQRVTSRRLHGTPLSMEFDVALRKLAQEMVPLVPDLTAGDRDELVRLWNEDLCGIEGIPAGAGLRTHHQQVRPDCGERKALREKPLELRMASISAGAALQNGLCKQRLAPKRKQALPVKVLGMQGPEAHGTEAPTRFNVRDQRRPCASAACRTMCARWEDQASQRPNTDVRARVRDGRKPSRWRSDQAAP